MYEAAGTYEFEEGVEMFEVDVIERKKYSDIFSKCEDSCILSALSGMAGMLYVDDEKNPEIYVVRVSDYCFLAGNSNAKTAGDCIRFIDSLFSDEYNIRCVDEGFEKVIEKVYGNRADKYSRFATVKSFEYMDFDKLSDNVKSLDKKFSLALIDEKYFNLCKKKEWMKDFVISYETYDRWEKTGLGVLILNDGEPVAGASSYSAYPGGIEIEIITREDYRKRGLALISGSALLLECKKRGLIASWDAAHERSLRLAEKLGYKFLYKYDIYNISK